MLKLRLYRIQRFSSPFLGSLCSQQIIYTFKILLRIVLAEMERSDRFNEIGCHVPKALLYSPQPRASFNRRLSGVSILSHAGPNIERHLLCLIRASSRDGDDIRSTEHQMVCGIMFQKNDRSRFLPVTYFKLRRTHPFPLILFTCSRNAIHSIMSALAIVVHKARVEAHSPDF